MMRTLCHVVFRWHRPQWVTVGVISNIEFPRMRPLRC